MGFMKNFKVMKKVSVLKLVFGMILFAATQVVAQNGYYDAPYVRYEADMGVLVNATATTKSFNQGLLQSEASEQVCVNMTNGAASVAWTVTTAGNGLVVRYSVPDGQSGALDVYANAVLVGTLNLSSNWSWEYLSSNGNPNNVGVTNTNPKMRFDEVRLRLPSTIAAGGNLRLVRTSGNIHLDFAELEPIPAAVPSAGGNVIYGGNGSDLQAVINANGGATIYIPAGVYNVNNELYFGANNTVLKGAGSWYTQIHFTNGAGNQGGIRANAWGVSCLGLYLTTVRNSRSNSYKALNGVYTGASRITDVWAEHFECGAWIGQYNAGGPAVADGFILTNCRFRNNYADGINLCKGTVNAIVEHTSFRNNGDDDMAIWSANGQECQNNTFQYCTSENTWRASGCAIYGGYNNRAHHLLIKDNVEVGIKVNNAFGGAPFNTGGMHEFSNITIKRCGTFKDLFDTPVGAIDLGSYDWGAGTRVQNVKFSCIEIIDSKNDAIYIKKATAGSDGFYNLVFENITVDGTGREYPDNGGTGSARGFGLLFKGFPNGNATYCNLTYANRGGNAGSNEDFSQKGSMSWNLAGSCPGGCTPSSSTTITSPTNGATFGGCSIGPIAITATTIAPSGNTVNYIEFFVDGVSIGTDNTSTYGITWGSPTTGMHAITAVSHYSPSNTTSTSSTTNIAVGLDIRTTAAPPTINGAIDASWAGYTSIPLNQGSASAPDLDATYKITYDATNLYLLFDVTDDALVRDGTGGTWEDDGVEIYIDMGNDKSGTYGANDFQYSFNWNSATILENKHSALTGVTLGQANRVGGYVMEVRIPWSTLGGAPSAGAYMGFDVKVNDDDNNGTRDNELGWFDGTYLAWGNPSLFGTLQFLSCGALPVKLLSFSAEKIEETVVLFWATATEVNNEFFIVERSSDLTAWEPIGEVAGAGNSTSIKNYSYTDYTPLKGSAHYRLRQVDIDGESAHSNIVVVETKLSSTKIDVMPNPFEDVLSIQSNVLGRLDISIHDVLGRLLYQTSVEKNTGSIVIHPELVSGTYIITIATDALIEQVQVIKR